VTTVINIDDVAALRRALGGKDIDVQVQRASLRTALAAVLPHVGDLVSLDRVRLQFVDDTGLVAIGASGYTVAIAQVRVDHVERLPELAVIDIEARSAREVLAVLVPPRDKDARGQWNTESFRVTATNEEVTFTEEGAILEGRSLTVPRLPHTDDEGRPTIYPDFPRKIAQLLDAPVAEAGEVDVALNPDLLGAWIKTAKVLETSLEVSPRRGHVDARRGLWVVRAGYERVVGALVPIHADEDHIDNVSPMWSRLLWRLVADLPTTPAGAAGSTDDEETDRD
jgi:hypothetical protein